MAKRAKTDDLSMVVDEDQRYFLNLESVSKHLFCTICQDVFSNPQRAPCGHSFCKICINQWLKQSNTCPSDRLPLRQSDMHHDFILQNIIGDQMVACPFRRLGCEFVGQLETSSIHKKKCSFNPSNMPEFLRLDALKNSLNKEEGSAADSEEDHLPEPAKPSLKMRLFSAGGDQRDLLCSMFQNDKSEVKDIKNQGKSDSKSRSKSRKRKSTV